MHRYSVLLVDDDPRVLNATDRVLSHFADRCSVVGLAANGRAAVELYFKLRPDLVLMDLGMPTMSGFDATALILRRDPAAKVVVVSAHAGLDWVVPALRIGAVGYVTKGSEPKRLIRALDAAMNEEMPIDPFLVRALVAGSQQPSVRPDLLTDRERQILALLAEGLSNDSIAERCIVSRGTVKADLASLQSKLDAVNRSHIVARAARLGLLDQGA